MTARGDAERQRIVEARRGLFKVSDGVLGMVAEADVRSAGEATDGNLFRPEGGHAVSFSLR